MANRPRRPKTGGRPETIIDGDAERVEGASGPATTFEAASVPDETVAADALKTSDENDVVVSGGEASPADRPVEPADSLGTPVMPDEEARIHDAVTAPVSSDADSVDPATGGALPGGGGDASAEVVSAERTEAGGADAATSETPARETPAEEFAREEGFATDAEGEPARRHLGEFEDDETVHPHAEAARSQTTVPDNSPYLAGHSAEPKGGAGFGSLLGAGALGALAALLLGGVALYGGILPPPPSAAEPVSPQQFAQAGDVQQLRSDLDTLRGSVEQVQSAQAAGGAGSGTVATADFTQLSDRVTAAERAIQSGGTSTGDAAAAAAGATEAANTARDTAANAEATAVAARDAATAAQGAAEEARTGVASAQQAAQNAQSAANEARSAVDGFGERLSRIEEANRQAAVALSAASLKAAIDRGSPFMSELESFATASGGAEAVAPLRDFAAAGVPTASALASEWRDVESAILTAVRPEVSTEDVGTQVLSGLRSLVTVRPSGSTVSPDAPGPEAGVARMDAAISSGDFEGWTREWDALPEAARTASDAFAARVRARVEADRIIQDTINGAVGASAS